MWSKFGKHHNFEELLSTAFIASLEAERTYNPNLAKFSAYIKPRIEGAIIRSVSNTSGNQYRLLSRLHKFLDKYIVLHDMVPSQNTIIQELGINESELQLLLEDTGKTIIVSMDDVLEGDVVSDIDMDLLAEYSRVDGVISELSVKQQKRVSEFIEDPTLSSEAIQDIIDIIRIRLKLNGGGYESN